MKAPFRKFGTIQRSYCNEQQIPIKPYEMNSNLNIDDANNKEYCVVVLEGVDEVLETMRIEEEKPIDDEIQPIKTFFEFESAIDFKALKLYTTLSLTSSTKCFAPMFKRKLDICMMNCDNHLRRFNETLTN